MSIRIVALVFLMVSFSCYSCPVRGPYKGFDNFDDLILNESLILLVNYDGIYIGQNENYNKGLRFTIVEIIKGRVLDDKIEFEQGYRYPFYFIDANHIEFEQGYIRAIDSNHVRGEYLEYYLKSGKYSDFKSHTSNDFWERKIAHKIDYGCNNEPYHLFTVGDSYLIFVDYLNVDVYSSDLIKNIDNDMWYKYVKNTINTHNQSLQSDAPEAHR